MLDVSTARPSSGSRAKHGTLSAPLQRPHSGLRIAPRLAMQGQLALRMGVTKRQERQELEMPSKPPKPNPYCGFKDDRERRRALQSRDLRLVLIALFCGGGGFSLLKLFEQWLAR